MTGAQRDGSVAQGAQAVAPEERIMLVRLRE